LRILIPTSKGLLDAQSETLESYYSTLGTPPQTLLSAPLILINHTHINQETCTFMKPVRGGVLVYGEPALPPMRGCNNDDMGMTTAFARVAQRSGALVLVIASVEKVRIKNRTKRNEARE
jgi:hypothetical protein